MRRGVIWSLIVLGLAVPVGMVGAWAFNPDSGTVLRSELLWRIFGIMAEGGLFLIALLLVLSLVGGLAAIVSVQTRKLLQ
jgi:hypothetical protein